MTPPDAPTVEWLTDDEQQSWRSVVAGTRRLLERLEQDLKEHGLAHGDFGLLVALSEAEDDRLRMSDLAERSLESRSRLSHHVRRLEQRDLVRRQSCPEDRRGSFAVLTEAGRALIEASAPHHVAAVRANLLDHLAPGELDLLAGIFARVDDAVAAADDDADTDG